MQSKIRKEDFLSLKSGETKAFLLPDYKACLSARSYAVQLNDMYPRADVERYSCSINKVDFIVTVTAVVKQKEL